MKSLKNFTFGTSTSMDLRFWLVSNEKRDPIPKIVAVFAVRVSDVELKLFSPAMMEGLIIEDRVRAENLVTTAAASVSLAACECPVACRWDRRRRSLSLSAMAGMLRDIGVSPIAAGR